MFTTRERFYRPPQHRQSLPLSRNPDPRVSKVFNVLCLPLSDFHGNVDSFIRRCYQSVKPTNEYVGNCIRFSTSRFRSNLFLLRTYSQRKEDMKRKRKQKLLISNPYKVTTPCKIIVSHSKKKVVPTFYQIKAYFLISQRIS